MAPGNYWLRLPSFEVMKAVEITVDDRDVTGVEVRVPRVVTVQGTVAVEGRAARPILSVGFRGPIEDLLETQTHPDGTFEVRLLEGEYRPVLQDLPKEYYIKSFTAGSVNLLTQPLMADGGNPSVRVALTLATSAGVKVSGRVKSVSEALPEYPPRRVTLTAAASRANVSAPVNADESFELDKVMPGTYSVRVSLNATVSSAPLIVVIPDKDTKDLDIIAPGLVEVFGRVTVDGNGPAPQFSLLLLRGAAGNFKSGNDGELARVEPSLLEALADSVAVQAIRVEVNPLPDGTFKMMLAEGVYRVASEENVYYNQSRGIPKPFFIRFLNYGPARLLTEPMIVSASENAQLQVGFGTEIPNPWVKVSGHVKGAIPSRGPYRVALEGRVLATLETPVNADGTFEFPTVLAGEEYTASILPATDGAHVARVRAATKDVNGVEIVVPAEREITVRASVEGGGPVPGFLLRLSTTPCKPNCASEMSVVVKPERDGTFKAKLPEDERKVDVYRDDLPFGYTVKSVTYGAIDLMKGDFLKIAGSDTRDLEVKLAIDPDIPSGSVRGRVTGLDPDSRRVQLVLTGVAFVSSFEEPVNADGSFTFSKLPQGTYALTLTGDVASGRPTPSAIVVSGKDLTGIQIAAPRRSARAERPRPDDRPTGTTITELGSATNETSSESAAVWSLRTINTAQVTYLSVSNGNYGTLQNLIDAGLLDESFLGIKAGYSFGVVAKGSGYVATAVPPTGGRYGFYSLPDAVVRYSLTDTLSPPRQAGNPVR
jgi:hypothetical protein